MGSAARAAVPKRMDTEMAAAGFKVLQAYDFLPEQFFVIYVLR